MANPPPYGLGPSSSAQLDRPYPGSNPYAPAGITDMTRQGWASQLEGVAGQQAAAQKYANQLGGFNATSSGGGSVSAGPDFVAQQFQMPGMDWLNTSLPNIGFQGSREQIAKTLGQYGTGLSAAELNQIGASFDPWNPKLRSEIAAANTQLGDQFREYTMPGLNRSLAGSGPGAYGGTRAGIAQGLATQGAMDAIQKNTTDMTSRGYEAGLGRYVADRGTTIQGLLQGRELGGRLGMQGAGMLSDQQIARLREASGLQQAGFQTRGALEQALMGTNAGMLNEAMGANARTRAAAISGNAGIASAGLAASAQNNRTNMMAQQAAAQLGMDAAGYGTEMGDRMERFGGVEQRNNQYVQDWYNQGYGHASDYPGEQLDAYGRRIDNITRPGNQGGVAPPGGASQQMPAGGDPWSAAARGGAAGAGLYNDWQRSQGNPYGYGGGGGGGYGGYGSGPVPGDAYGPAYGPGPTYY